MNRYTALILLIMIIPWSGRSQNSLGSADDFARMEIANYVPEQISLTNEARSLLSNKLEQIVTGRGMGAANGTSRFIITCNVNVLNKDVTPTTPAMHSYGLEVTFIIGDGIEGQKFASLSKNIKGIGPSETKAYVDAFKQLKPSDKSFDSFVEQGKTRIVEYYNSRCDFLISQAKMMESKNDLLGALDLLGGVPQICKECFDKCMNAIGPIYQKFIDRQCRIELSNARNSWNASQDRAGADQAAEYLARIDPNSVCYEEAKQFSNSVAKRILELDKREWNFRLKQQRDAVNLESERIRAVRDIGVAYGTGQPKSIVYNVRGWW